MPSRPPYVAHRCDGQRGYRRGEWSVSHWASPSPGGPTSNPARRCERARWSRCPSRGSRLPWFEHRPAT
uniref:Uncharacterized protein n=1 Tax=uncultured marine virus TaxID=186617 RepID=A0A0F7L6E1_9VIRU|nr:hypothetical protein [uncultured marine virus]